MSFIACGMWLEMSFQSEDEYIFFQQSLSRFMLYETKFENKELVKNVESTSLTNGDSMQRKKSNLETQICFSSPTVAMTLYLH